MADSAELTIKIADDSSSRALDDGPVRGPTSNPVSSFTPAFSTPQPAPATPQEQPFSSTEVGARFAEAVPLDFESDVAVSVDRGMQEVADELRELIGEFHLWMSQESAQSIAVNPGGAGGVAADAGVIAGIPGSVSAPVDTLGLHQPLAAPEPVEVTALAPPPVQVDAIEPHPVEAQVYGPDSLTITPTQGPPLRTDVVQPAPITPGVEQPDAIRPRVEQPGVVRIATETPTITPQVTPLSPVTIPVNAPAPQTIDVVQPDTVRPRVETPEPVTVSTVTQPQGALPKLEPEQQSGRPPQVTAAAAATVATITPVVIRQMGMPQQIAASVAAAVQPVTVAIQNVTQRQEHAIPAATGTPVVQPAPQPVSTLLSKAPPPENQTEILSKVHQEATERDLNDAMRELGGVNIQQRGIDPAVAANFDAHGTNTLADLTKLLNSGIDPNREFYSEQLDARVTNAPGALLRDNSPFVALSHPGQKLKEGGIGGVLVDDLHTPNIPDLQQAFPGIKFVPASKSAQTLAKVAAPTKSPAASDSGTSPLSTASVTPSAPASIDTAVSPDEFGSGSFDVAGPSPAPSTSVEPVTRLLGSAPIAESMRLEEDAASTHFEAARQAQRDHDTARNDLERFARTEFGIGALNLKGDRGEPLPPEQVEQVVLRRVPDAPPAKVQQIVELARQVVATRQRADETKAAYHTAERGGVPTLGSEPVRGPRAMVEEATGRTTAARTATGVREVASPPDSGVSAGAETVDSGTVAGEITSAATVTPLPLVESPTPAATPVAAAGSLPAWVTAPLPTSKLRPMLDRDSGPPPVPAGTPPRPPVTPGEAALLPAGTPVGSAPLPTTSPIRDLGFGLLPAGSSAAPPLLGPPLLPPGTPPSPPAVPPEFLPLSLGRSPAGSPPVGGSSPVGGSPPSAPPSTGAPIPVDVVRSIPLTLAGAPVAAPGGTAVPAGTVAPVSSDMPGGTTGSVKTLTDESILLEPKDAARRDKLREKSERDYRHAVEDERAKIDPKFAAKLARSREGEERTEQTQETVDRAEGFFRTGAAFDYLGLHRIGNAMQSGGEATVNAGTLFGADPDTSEGIGAVVATLSYLNSAISDSVTQIGRFGGSIAAIDADGLANEFNNLVKQIPLVGSTLGTFGDAVGNVVRGLDQTVNRLASYSPDLAATQAAIEVRQIERDIERAQRSGPDLAQYAVARQELRERFEDMMLDTFNKLVPAITSILDLAGRGVEFLKPVGDILGWIYRQIEVFITMWRDNVSREMAETQVDRREIRQIVRNTRRDWVPETAGNNMMEQLQQAMNALRDPGNFPARPGFNNNAGPGGIAAFEGL